MNILLSAIGRRGYLVKYFKEIKGVKVYACDTDIHAPGLYDADTWNIISEEPYFYDEYVDALVNMCDKLDIDGLISLNDEEIKAIDDQREKFENIPTELILSRSDVLDMTYDKLEMYNKFKDYMPETDYDVHWPVYYPYIIKNKYGSASSGFKKIYSKRQHKINFSLGGQIVQEFIDGPEYNAQVFNNEKGEPVSVYIMKKLSMRAGETDKAISINSSGFTEWIKEIALKSGVYGPIDIDFIESDYGDTYLLDINPRFGGCYPLAHALGANFPQKIVDLLNGKRLYPDFKEYKEDVVMMKQHEIVIR